MEPVVVVGSHFTTDDAAHVLGQAHVERGSQAVGAREGRRALAVGQAVGVLHAMDGVGARMQADEKQACKP